MSGGLIIFGRETESNFGPTVYARCGNCGNSSYFVLLFVKTWLEYFFIKIFAYKKRYLLLCPICSRGVELKGRQVIGIVTSLNEATSNYRNGSLPYERYLEIYDGLREDIEIILGFAVSPPPQLLDSPGQTAR